MNSPHSRKKSSSAQEKIAQTLADVEGLEKLQLMQLTLLREIRSQLLDLQKKR